MHKSSLVSSIFTVLRILHAERFGHLRLCIEPDWHAVNSSKKTAMAQLIKLGEWLGCRDSPRVLQWPELICLQRGADAILAAVHRAGGAQALAAADPAAAVLLCHGLMQLPGGVRKSVQHEFAALAPDVLPAALADVSALAPGSPCRAHSASCLANAFLRLHTVNEAAAWQLGLQPDPSVQAQKQVCGRYDALMQAQWKSVGNTSAALPALQTKCRYKLGSSCLKVSCGNEIALLIYVDCIPCLAAEHSGLRHSTAVCTCQ